MTAPIQKAPRIAVVRDGGRTVSTRGFTMAVFEEHLREHESYPLSQRWCEVECVARVMWGRNSPSNQRRVRVKMRTAFRVLLTRGLFLLREYEQGAHGKIKNCKLLDMGIESERQYAEAQLKRMRRYREISTVNFERACRVANIDPSILDAQS